MPLLKQLKDLAWELKCRLLLAPVITRLTIVSLFSSKPVIQPDGDVVVSLTSYGKRLQTVHLTIESIAYGDVLPSRLILWLDDLAAFENPPANLRRFIKRGLEIKHTRNYGSHTKYYPYVEATEHFDQPLVTADDDILYPKNWLSRLVIAFQHDPNVISCHGSKVTALKGSTIDSYNNWKVNTTTVASYLHLSEGVAGTIFPPKYLGVLKSAGAGFEQCCPKADDLWLHVQALRSGFRTRQIAPKSAAFPAIPGTASGGLWEENYNGGNDRQVAATYTAQDLLILLREDHSAAQ
jgi:hypothetical protein